MTLVNRIADLSTIWKQASLVFPYFDKREIDWDQKYREYLAQVMNTASEREFHLMLAEFVNLLGDGHTDYALPGTLQDEAGYLPFALRYIRDGYFIDAALPEHAAFVGAQLLSLNGTPFAEIAAEIKRYSYHVGNYITRLHQFLPFLLKRRSNTAVTSLGSFTFDLSDKRETGLRPRVLNTGCDYRRMKTGKLDIRLYGGGILYIRMDDFMYGGAADEVRGALTQTDDISGVILDIRENIGGMTLNGARVAELFISGKFHGCRKRTRSMTGIALSSASQIIRWSGETAEKYIAEGLTSSEEVEQSRRLMGNAYFENYVDTFGSEGNAAIFDGPCMLLTSRRTVSAAEDFTAMFRTNRRAVILGTGTCGTTGTPYLQRLACGGAMRVCSVGYSLMDGTEFIGCGIEPDIYCEGTAEDFLRGHDHVLSEGIADAQLDMQWVQMK